MATLTELLRGFADYIEREGLNVDLTNPAVAPSKKEPKPKKDPEPDIGLSEDAPPPPATTTLTFEDFSAALRKHSTDIGTAKFRAIARPILDEIAGSGSTIRDVPEDRRRDTLNRVRAAIEVSQ